MLISNHVFHDKGFQNDHLVFVYQFGCRFVGKVTPTIRDFGVNLGNLELCLFEVVGAFFLFHQASLVLGQFVGVTLSKLRITRLIAVAGDEQISQTNINTYFVIVNW